jgi:hypothetical protein
MEHNMNASVLPFGKTTNARTAPIKLSPPVLGIVLQDNFSSDEDREEFMQTITSHGITFLRCANAPLPTPTDDDLSLLEKLARVLSGLWAATDEQRGCNV